MTETGERAVSLLGVAKPYHERARRALPVLVRQARALETIEYGRLAAELGMPNPRNLNYPLGAIGQTLLDLSNEWGARVPPLQALVINKSDGLPGEGVAHFTPDAKLFARATRAERRMIVQTMLQEVYTYPDWNRVLVRLGVKPDAPPPLPPVEAVVTGTRGGEGEDHRALKELVAETPELVGAMGLTPLIEAPLYSGDSVDVLFQGRRRVLAVEVKGERSPGTDMLRGLFQCVKYQAVLEAQAKVSAERKDIEAILVLGGRAPADLQARANTLGVRIIDEVTAIT